jgi:putative cell wall-binding protein
VLGLVPVVTAGLASPVLVTHAGDARLFVVEQAGRIRIVDGGTLLPAPFLDISGPVLDGGERGLLGLAFHPQFAANRRFFVFYTRDDGDLQVSEFLRSSGNANLADPASERPLLRIEHSANTNHNGGMLAFGPDGMLFVATGDGGGGGDPFGAGQDINSRLGKILRINVDAADPATQPPPDNPFVGTAGDDLIWSLGLRNPWRFGFDRANGDLWIADVGQGSWEEVNRATAASGRGRGANFGWSVMEGAHCYNASTCSQAGLTLPLAEYAHGSGDCSVTGGYVYRGSASPVLTGLYLFGDFCSGRIWSVAAGGPAIQAPTLLLDTTLGISSFGEDAAGELYVVSLGGSIHRLVASGGVSRIAGADRYATAAAVSAATFAPGVRAVLVATGENYPDALAAGGAAHAWGAPVLLVRQGSIPAAVAAELDRLDPERILVLGGPAVVSDAVAAALGAYATGGVTRLAGGDRYATAAAVSAATFAPGVPVAYVATGRNYPDALAGASAAAVEHGPVLLVPGSFIPPSVAAELDRLNPARIVVLGGPAVVSDGVIAVLGAYATGGVSRIAGPDRYATAAAVSASVFAAGVPVVYVATGENYPDALAGGPAAAREIGPVLLVRQGSIPGSVAAELDRLDPARIVVLGGPAVVSDAVAAALGGYVRP